MARRAGAPVLPRSPRTSRRAGSASSSADRFTSRAGSRKKRCCDRRRRPMRPSRAGRGDIDQRHARLVDERRQDPIDRLAGRRRHGGPEVLRRRVAVRMRLQVRVDALAERLGARDSSRSSAGPPRPFRTRWRRTLRRSRPASRRARGWDASTAASRGSSAVWFCDALRRRRRSSRAAARPARGSPSTWRSLRSARCRPTTSSSPGRRTTGAPSRGRARRRCACGRRATRPCGSTSRSRFAIENRGGVFHGAGREVGHGDDVELAERIFDGEVAVVERQDLLRRVERDAAELLLAFGVAQMRIGMSSAAPSRHSKSPTAIATRYDDIFGVVANLTVWRPPPAPACPTPRGRWRSPCRRGRSSARRRTSP